MYRPIPAIRIAILIAWVQTSTEIGAQQAQLVDQLVKARERKRQAEALCHAGTRHARNRLKHAIRKMIQYGHRLRSGAARRSIAPALRSELIAHGEGIGTDLKALEGALRCPGDAPAA